MIAVAVATLALDLIAVAYGSTEFCVRCLVLTFILTFVSPFVVFLASVARKIGINALFR
jgi:hypothetical protein